MPESAEMRSSLIAAYEAAVVACDPEFAVASAICVDRDGITVGGHRFIGATPDDVAVVAIGKAASGMVRGVVSVLGPVRGIAVSNHTEPCPVPLVIGSHPVPDEASLVCGEALIEYVENLSSTDLVLYLISGGGSAIVAAPVAGITLEDLATLNETLLRVGVPIGDMNEIRAAVSKIKGGRLARVCPARHAVTLVLSDVIGAGPAHVASGPSLGAGMGAAASAVVSRYALESLLPASVVSVVGQLGRVLQEAPHPFSVVGSADVAARAAADYLASHGFRTVIATTGLTGEARTAAVEFTRAAAPAAITIAAGETTVTVTGDGVGGRNQEAALAVAIEISGTDTVYAALGTDGIDGATPAAGAVVDGDTAARALALGVDLGDALARNDSHTALAALDAVVVRGDTGTNVGDLWMVAKGLLSRVRPGSP
ncbi:MAG: glycerate kinase [Acidimicrobiia bacterium]|nr:MAG: glycerate kinase [Acidimicrobiia bacterium]